MKKTKIYASENSLKADSIDMTLSINPLGCSSKVISGLNNINIQDISKYPNDTDIRLCISKKFKLQKENILMGSGSEQLIKLIAQTFIKKGDKVLVQSGSFPLFTKETKLKGGNVKYFDPNNFAREEYVKLVFISNPSTPTGEVFDRQIIERLLKLFPKSIIVVDEANGDFINQTAIKFILSNPNLIVLRTFSKVFGLAGLRIGFAVGNGSKFNKLLLAQQAFVISSIACKLAIVALSDEVFIEKTREFFQNERTFMTNELKKLGFRVSNSSTNNLFISGNDIKNTMEKLKEKRVGVIDNTYFPNLNEIGFRISLRDNRTNKKFLLILESIIDATTTEKK